MAVPKFVVKKIVKKVVKSVLKKETMGKYKKQVKAEVAAAQKEVDTNLDVDLATIAKSQSTRKEIREEAKKRRKNKSEITMKGPFYKMSKEAFGNLSVEAKQDNNSGISQADFVIYANNKANNRPTMMSDLKKHCYNSKKKK